MDEKCSGKILLVDDMPTNIQVLYEALGEEHEVTFATNGLDALKACHEDPPDLVLLDVDMPEMDGFEVCRRLKGSEDTKEIPVIFVTAMDGEKEEVIGLELGASDFIPKPVRPGVVKMRVENQLTLKRYRERLESMSFQDGLTGIANRRRFESTLKSEWHRSIREKRGFSLIMMDVDHFKLFNDHYGHQEGDHCLRAVAQALSDAIKRDIDLVARYGGEEFVALLPRTDQEGACQVAEGLRQSVMALAIPHEASPSGEVVTISVGCAFIDPKPEDAPASAIEQADACLYRSKEAGRNRVICEG
ncbi:MAG: diguanylate cyclase [Magnetococcales bacterium]|nr:diguanylate cyclase [Magnetococcales bacterium]